MIAHRTLRNFSAGPGALPASVLALAQQAVLALPENGVSILSLSHRSQLFRDILDEAEERIRQLSKLPAHYRVLFLQGGGTLQFSMVPLAMLPAGAVADYVLSGYWSEKSVEAARFHGQIRVIWDGSSSGFKHLPVLAELPQNRDAAYFHYVSNETVEGLHFSSLPQVACPLVCDMSSDFLSRPLDVTPYSLIYAHAQKNIGPAGVTVVLIRDDVLERCPAGLPPILDYRAHARERSLLHTPPVFSIYVVLLVLRWLADEVGGLESMGKINAEKAALVRAALAAQSWFYREDAAADCASAMNVTFRCPTAAQDALFSEAAERAGLIGTEGHRSRGGLRISLYNAVTVEDARTVAEFLNQFAQEQR